MLTPPRSARASESVLRSPSTSTFFTVVKNATRTRTTSLETRISTAIRASENFLPTPSPVAPKAVAYAVEVKARDPVHVSHPPTTWADEVPPYVGVFGAALLLTAVVILLRHHFPRFFAFLRRSLGPASGTTQLKVRPFLFSSRLLQLSLYIRVGSLRMQSRHSAMHPQ